MFLKGISALGLLFIFSQSLSAQLSPSWNCEFKSDVNWQKVTSFGFLIVGTDDNLAGVDPESGEMLWKEPEFDGLSKSTLSELPNSPLVRITQGSNITILDPLNGKTLFNTEKAGYEDLTTKKTLFKSGGFLAAGEKDGGDGNSATYVDLESGKTIWSIDGLEKLISVYEINDEELLMIGYFKMYRVNSSTGDIVWENVTSPQVEKTNQMGKLGSLIKKAAQSMAEKEGMDIEFFIHPEEKMFIIANHGEHEKSSGINKGEIEHSVLYYAYDASDGKFLWPEEGVEDNGDIGKVFFADDGVIIFSNRVNKKNTITIGNSNRVNLIDYETGKKQWGKRGRGIKYPGDAIRTIKNGDSYLVISGSSRKTYINILNASKGEFKWEDPVEIRGSITHMEKTPSGILVIADEEINLVDLNKGKLLFEDGVPTGKRLYRKKGKYMFTWSPDDEAVYGINMETAEKRKMSKEELDFESREDPTELEITEDGFLLTSERNIALFNKKGSLVYNKYYEAPSRSGIMQVLLVAKAMGSMMNAATSSMSASVYGAASMQTEEGSINRALGATVTSAYAHKAKNESAQTGSTLKKAFERFTASDKSKDYLFMLKEADDGNHLIQVNKEDGEIKDYINLGDEREPSYQVDDVASRIYYRSEDEKISGYKFE